MEVDFLFFFLVLRYGCILLLKCWDFECVFIIFQLIGFKSCFNIYLKCFFYIVKFIFFLVQLKIIFDLNCSKFSLCVERI